MAGKLYIVATPIGNLKDITFRAIRTLKEVDLILAEDTRNSRKLLDSYQIATPMESYHQHSNGLKMQFILNNLISGKNMGLITDAGTPGISDPGNELIDYLLTQFPELEIIAIPGASALTTALSVSGMNVNKFVFLGFIPKNKRLKLLNWVKEGKISFAFYEAPQRLPKTLKQVAEVFEYRGSIMIARELTKTFETLYRGDFNSILQQIDGKKLKGEVVVVIEPE